MSKFSEAYDHDGETHPMLEWFSTNKKFLLWGFLGLLILLFTVHRLVAVKTVNAEKDFFHAQTIFTKLQKEAFSSASNAVLADTDQLEVIMKRHPEIKPKYDGFLAETLLMTGNVAQSEKLAEDVFERVQLEDLQFYKEFSRISFLIGNRQYAEALQPTEQLKLALDQLEKTRPVLYTFNLIRLALLYQQLGQIQEEMSAWNELQLQIASSEAFSEINHLFKVGQASLNQYIEERKERNL